MRFVACLIHVVENNTVDIIELEGCLQNFGEYRVIEYLPEIQRILMRDDPRIVEGFYLIQK